jgi:hypothetical protein
MLNPGINMSAVFSAAKKNGSYFYIFPKPFEGSDRGVVA